MKRHVVSNIQRWWRPGAVSGATRALRCLWHRRYGTGHTQANGGENPANGLNKPASQMRADQSAAGCSH
eukprot:7386022-Prymnesium_polylepis.1